METNIQTETIEIGAKDGADLKESLPDFSGSALESNSKAETIAMILRVRCYVQARTVNCKTVTIEESNAKIAIIRQMLGELGLVEVGGQTAEDTPMPTPTLQEKPHTISLKGNATVAYLESLGAWDNNWVEQDLGQERRA